LILLFAFDNQAIAKNTNVPPLAFIAAGAVLLISKPELAVSM
jgi:hypothetical protein